MNWRLDSNLMQTGSAALYQCGRPFLFAIPYLLFIHTHIIPMCLDQFVAHCLDIIDIQLRCGMGFEHGDHTTFSPSIFHFYWILVFQLLLPLADLLLFPRLVFHKPNLCYRRLFFHSLQNIPFFSSPFFGSFLALFCSRSFFPALKNASCTNNLEIK